MFSGDVKPAKRKRLRKQDAKSPLLLGEGGPGGARDGCGGDTRTHRMGQVAWQTPPVRVGDDALIVPQPYGGDRQV